MDGIRRDIAELHEVFPSSSRPVPSVTRCARLLHPLHERLYCTDGTITVVDLEREAARSQIVLHELQGLGHLAKEDAFARLISVNSTSSKIVCSRVANVLNNGRVDIPEIDEFLRQPRHFNPAALGDHKSCHNRD